MHTPYLSACILCLSGSFIHVDISVITFLSVISCVFCNLHCIASYWITQNALRVIHVFYFPLFPFLILIIFFYIFYIMSDLWIFRQPGMLVLAQIACGCCETAVICAGSGCLIWVLTTLFRVLLWATSVIPPTWKCALENYIVCEYHSQVLNLATQIFSCSVMW